MKKLHTLGLTVVAAVGMLIAPVKAQADCAILSGLSWGSLGGLVVGGVTGAAVGNQVFDAAGAAAGAVVFGLLGLVTGAAIGLGVGVIMCVVENQCDNPVYAEPLLPLLSPDAGVVAVVRGEDLLAQIDRVTHAQPRIRLASVGFVQAEPLPLF